MFLAKLWKKILTYTNCLAIGITMCFLYSDMLRCHPNIKTAHTPRPVMLILPTKKTAMPIVVCYFFKEYLRECLLQGREEDDRSFEKPHPAPSEQLFPLVV